MSDPRKCACPVWCFISFKNHMCSLTSNFTTVNKKKLSKTVIQLSANFTVVSKSDMCWMSSHFACIFDNFNFKLGHFHLLPIGQIFISQ